MRWLPFMVAAIWLGCSEAPKSACEAGTCAGCCTSKLECLTGTTNTGCGTGGQLCQSCAAPLSCDASSRQCIRGGSGGRDAGVTAPSCNAPSECPAWFCNCRGTTPTHTQRCVDNLCQDAPAACPGACAAITSCWSGTATGGYAGGASSGETTCGSCTITDLGRGCQTGNDCQSGLCNGAASSFICTKSCATPDECPVGWECALQTDGSHACMLGQPTGVPVSSGTACTEVYIDDVNTPCTAQCKAKVCVSNKCTRRCGPSTDCGTWSCKLSPQGIYLCAP